MHCGWWDHMVSLSSSGPAGVPLAIPPILWTPCQSTTYLLTQNSGWLLSRFILSVPSRYSAAFLCEDEGRLIPVLFCNAQEHLIACRQNPWPRKGATRPVLLGRRWGCGNQWQGDSLISVWAAVAPLPIRSKLHASLSATTPVSSLQPPLHVPPLSSSPFEWPLNIHHYSDYYCLSGWCIQNKALACSGVALFWFLCLSVHGFVMDVTRRPINCVLTGLLGRMLQWTMSSKRDHTYATPLI